jgi:hypothetical protein
VYVADVALNKSSKRTRPPQVQPKFTASRMVMAYLNDLTKTELYGPAVSNVIEHFVSVGIERAIAAGVIKPRTEPTSEAALP